MHNKPIKEVMKDLNSTERGLSKHEAETRINKYGFNELKEQDHVHPIRIFLEQFASPLVWILLVALIISISLHETIDAIVIGIIIVLNAILGFIQEYRAEKSIEALRKMASLKAKVLRDGKEIKIESKFVVPGDIIILETGDKIPADARLIEIHTLETQEGPLTGESQPVTKDLTVLKDKTPLADRKNMVYSATVISNGRGKAVVVSTGMKTEVGKIATLIKASHPKLTPLQKKLRQLGKYLTIAVVIVAIVVFLAGVLSGKAASVMFLTAIALAVAAIPEGLPAVITISLALGVQRMIKKNALVRKLPSVETLGSVSVICTDKTGTLTHNEMTVTKIWANNNVYDITGSGYEAEGTFLIKKKLANPEHLHALLTIGAQCNDSHFDDKEVFGDPTEAALIISAQKAGFTKKELEKKQPRTDEIPFSSERKMMTTFHGKVSYTKGAPDILIEMCNRILINGKVQRLTRDKIKEIIKQNESFAGNALRVLGFAYNESVKKAGAEKNMIFVGLQAMIDPPREEVKEAIKRCQDAGIRVIMITGDQITTAEAIAKELGINGKSLTGQELDAHKNLKQDIKNISIFARVNPEHKLKIVEALKKDGQVVAMTGDGVNDAPALKKADIGISMGITGTDVAKEASDMILTDDNFTSIVNAVEEGRGIFENIRKFVNYLLSSNLGEITVILFASLYSSVLGLNLGLPLTAIQILWVNLVTDGLPATALSLDPHSKDIMGRKPRPARESILSKELRSDIIVFGVLMGIISLVLFILYQDSGIIKAQTIVFTSLVLFELVRLQTIRAEYKLSMFSNRWLLAAIVVSVLLHFATIYTPLNVWFKTTPLALVDWGVLIIASGVLYGVYRIIHYFMNGKK
ncbi:calcium-translocating P-type ATPase, SERCA-type [Candidatus Woesearchaeota archaeon]|jgi:P-type Ca2+ transporter type 2C|nr:calcium-translocating P-type ATPase, SERCA-type [Candidatus Woesearchaeota archaeon]MBT5397057.1 calcium-translocating P-type ATPase, SERCA-type [Candidatus Woesearchaeota archaeon]MBT5924978.1 calcium-translocating P-type ATPase, SERCA-type [Candidatus Woesearchaeota archaeon]MBT6367397.1 calcium-translocating P-type ATPase, SERCA-type [Candidatus Woesearchaeota archaeon]MBT7762457.1 calcium-translocating P-type ATPase, SERCA-type [Candidatus Woesearchaeota archaeon]